MHTLLGLIWFLLAGIWLAIGYTVAGVITCVFVIAIPFDVATFRMASYIAWPFDKAVVRRPSAGVGSGIMNLIWSVFCGQQLALEHVITVVAQAMTTVGIVNTIVSLKVILVTCSPFGKQIVDRNNLAPWDRPLHSI